MGTELAERLLTDHALLRFPLIRAGRGLTMGRDVVAWQEIAGNQTATAPTASTTTSR